LSKLQLKRNLHSALSKNKDGKTYCEAIAGDDIFNFQLPQPKTSMPAERIQIHFKAHVTCVFDKKQLLASEI